MHLDTSGDKLSFWEHLATQCEIKLFSCLLKQFRYLFTHVTSLLIYAFPLKIRLFGTAVCRASAAKTSLQPIKRRLTAVRVNFNSD